MPPVANGFVDAIRPDGEMPLDIKRALREGYDRTIAPNGVILAGVFFVLSGINAVAAAGAGPRYPAMRFGMFGRPSNPIVWPELPIPLAGLLSLLASLGTIVVAIAALRTFVTDETETLPENHFRRRIGWAFLNFLVGAIVFGIIVGLGFVLLVIPGIFLLVSLIFWEVFVAVEDENFVESLRRSWQLAQGNRWQLFGLGFVVLLVTLVVNVVFSVPGAIVGGFGGVLFAQAGSAVTTVFGSAVLARSYCQLTDESITDTTTSTDVTTGEAGSTTTVEDTDVGADQGRGDR